ncbi:MAG: UvrD-helicase domain-containing protein [Thermodesulfobacteriota bacterium]
MAEVIADKREREEALDPARSFVVQAPAGSGKTELLMQRYLVLLSMAERPEQILAITFTRKAAGEMQNRVIESLAKARSGHTATAPHEVKTLSLARAVLERDSKLCWDILDNPGRLRVQTIDSLSAELVRLTPLLSRLGRQPVMDDNPQELYREAARRTVEMVELEGPDGEAVRKALGHLDNSVKALSGRIVDMLGRRDQWHRHVERKDDSELRAVLEGSLRSLVEDELGRIREAFPAGMAERLLPLAWYAAENLKSLGKDSPITALAGIDALPPGPGAGDLPAWKGVRALLLTKENQPRRPGGVNKNIGFPADRAPEAMAAKEDFSALLEELAGDGAAVEALARVAVLPAPRFADKDWEILEALLHLLPIARRHLDAVFAGAGAADFQAVSMAALDSLGSELDPTELMLALDLRIRHILVDEYQDTSQAQLSLLKALTRGWEPGDGRTLFIVGDPMQSIYLFREAQVGLFLDALKEGVGTVKLDFLRLCTNFRSDAGIVDWVNGSFSGAFPATEEGFTGSIRYAPSVAVKGGGHGEPVVTRLYRGRSDEQEARDVVSALAALPPGETAAVLCRTRPHVRAIVEELKREGMCFRAQDIDPLAGRPVIIDLFSLLRALAHPFDRVAWLACLRAPWCGLTLADLHALCALDAGSPVRGLMGDPARRARLSGDGRKRVERVAAAFEEAFGLWGRAPAAVVLEGLWIRLGGPACAGDERSMRDAEAFFGLVEPMGAAPAQREILRLEERLEELYADHGGGEDVRIDVMTVHKAKGLEFDHVMIPGLGKPSRPEKKKLLLWMERGDGLLLAPIAKSTEKDGNPIYSYLSSVNRLKSGYERTRLFYVAATRARKRLYLFGHVDSDAGEDADAGEVSAPGGTFLSDLDLRAQMLVAPGQAAAPPEVPAGAGQRPRQRLKRLPVGWRPPEPEPAAGAEPAPETGAGGEPEFYWAGSVRRHIGTVVHRCLCRIAGEGLAGWGQGRVKGAVARMEAELRTLGLGAAEARAGAAEAVGILCRALGDERGRWILFEHEESAVEMPLTGVVGGAIVHAIIDRTFVEGGVRWVVDYKSGTHEGGSVEWFLESERERYRRQLDRYEALLRAGGEVREIRKGLYYPALGAWIEL